jgi:hypothetical protein
MASNVDKEENMSETPNGIKFTDEERKELTDLQTSYGKVVFNLGKMYVERLSMERAFAILSEQEKTLQSQLDDCQKKERSWTEKMAAKYGDGSLDTLNGVFIPDQNSPTPRA